MESKQNYFNYKNKLTSLIRNAEKKLHRSFWNSKGKYIRDIWKLINKAIHGRQGFEHSSTIPSLSVNELVINYHKVIVSTFNDSFFANVGPNLASQIQPVSSTISIFDTLPNPNSDSMFIVPCTTSEVTDTIDNLQNCKAIGLDGFLTSIVKSVSNHIAESLTHIFKLWFTSVVFPGNLKHAKVTPIFKSNDKLSVNNYRPISLLPVFSKVLQKLMHKRLVSFFYKCNLLTVTVWI